MPEKHNRILLCFEAGKERKRGKTGEREEGRKKKGKGKIGGGCCCFLGGGGGGLCFYFLRRYTYHELLNLFCWEWMTL